MTRVTATAMTRCRYVALLALGSLLLAAFRAQKQEALVASIALRPRRRDRRLERWVLHALGAMVLLAAVIR